LLDLFLSKSKGILDVNMKDESGMTALHTAALRGQFGCCEFLLQKADVTVMALSFDGSTALHFLVGHPIEEKPQINEFKRVLQAMISRGVFLSAQDKHGNTALHNVILLISDDR
jgi:ankyrin repeat protein